MTRRTPPARRALLAAAAVGGILVAVGMFQGEDRDAPPVPSPVAGGPQDETAPDVPGSPHDAAVADAGAAPALAPEGQRTDAVTPPAQAQPQPAGGGDPSADFAYLAPAPEGDGVVRVPRRTDLTAETPGATGEPDGSSSPRSADGDEAPAPDIDADPPPAPPGPPPPKPVAIAQSGHDGDAAASATAPGTAPARTGQASAPSGGEEPRPDAGAATARATSAAGGEATEAASSSSAEAGKVETAAVERFVALAREQRREGRLVTALKTVRAGLAQAPEEPQLVALRTEIQSERERRRAAVAAARAAQPANVPEAGELARLYAVRADYELTRGKPRDALVSVAHGLEAVPNDDRLRQLRARALEQLRVRAAQ